MSIWSSARKYHYTLNLSTTPVATVANVDMLLKAAGEGDAELSTSLANDNISEFAQDTQSWWGCYTNCISFGEQSSKSKERFHRRVHTDGVSVSVSGFHPEPKQFTDMGKLQQLKPTTA